MEGLEVLVPLGVETALISYLHSFADAYRYRTVQNTPQDLRVRVQGCKEPAIPPLPTHLLVLLNMDGASGEPPFGACLPSYTYRHLIRTP